MKQRCLPHLTGLFFGSISSGMFMMALPWMLLKQGDNGTFVAILMLICTLTSFFITPFSATLIDRLSRKKILIAAESAQGLCAFIILTTYQLQFESEWLLAFTLFIFWQTNDISWLTNNAFTQENYKKKEYAKISGYQEVVLQMTTLGAGAAGIVALENWSIREFSLFSATCSLLSVLGFLLTPYFRSNSRTSINTKFVNQFVESKTLFLQQPKFYLFLAMSCLSYPALTFLGKLVPIYFAGLGTHGGWFASWQLAYGFGALACGLIIAQLLQKFEFEKAMMACMLVLSTLLILMGFALTPITIVILTLFIGFFNSYNRIARTNKMNHEVDNDHRGRVDGGLKLFSTLSQSLSYMLIAILTHFQMTHLGFSVMGVVLLVAGLIMFILYKQQAHRQLASS